MQRCNQKQAIAIFYLYYSYSLFFRLNVRSFFRLRICRQIWRENPSSLFRVHVKGSNFELILSLYQSLTSCPGELLLIFSWRMTPFRHSIGRPTSIQNQSNDSSHYHTWCYVKHFFRMVSYYVYPVRYPSPVSVWVGGLYRNLLTTSSNHVDSGKLLKEQ